MLLFSVEFFGKVIIYVVYQLQEYDLGEEYILDLKVIFMRYSSIEDLFNLKDEMIV